MRPRIAITAWRRALPTFLGERTDLYTLGAEYVRRVRDAGGLPLLLPHLDPDAVGETLDAVDGLLLAGGGDVDPSSYDAASDGSYGTDVAADASELALAAEARRRDLPTLAICRGMQIVNVEAGGTLQQDIGVQGTDHEPIGDDPDATLAARHAVEIVPGSRLAALFGAGHREVNTIHHQAIERLGAGLRVTATAGDGIVEAVEYEGWQMLGVQWHPEKLGSLDAPLFRWLVDAAATVALPARGGG